MAKKQNIESASVFERFYGFTVVLGTLYGALKDTFTIVNRNNRFEVTGNWLEDSSNV